MVSVTTIKKLFTIAILGKMSRKVKKFKIGDRRETTRKLRVQVKSVLAKSMLLGVPTTIELARHPSLIGVVLTIVEISNPWIICQRNSGTFAPGLTAEDLEYV